MCCFVRGVSNCPLGQKREGKKLKPLQSVSKSINPNSIFICIHYLVSENVSKSGVWLAPNARGYEKWRDP
jgi:hypothetical protein